MPLIRDLGLTTFKCLIDNKVAKAYLLPGFIRTCAGFSNTRWFVIVYIAHAHLEYASPLEKLWCGPHHSDEIESIQKKFVIYALRRVVRRDSDSRLPLYANRCICSALKHYQIEEITYAYSFYDDGHRI